MLDQLPAPVLVHLCAHLGPNDISRLRRVNSVLRGRIYTHRPSITREGTNTRRRIFRLHYDHYHRIRRYILEDLRVPLIHYNPVGKMVTGIEHAVEVQVTRPVGPHTPTLVVHNHEALAHFIRVEGVTHVELITTHLAISPSFLNAYSHIHTIDRIHLGSNINHRERFMLPWVQGRIGLYGDPSPLEFEAIRRFENIAIWKISKCTA